MKFFSSLKLINFLKDIIYYLKQLKFVVFTHSKGIKKFFFLCGQGDVKFFCMFLQVLKFVHCILILWQILNPPPPRGNN